MALLEDWIVEMHERKVSNMNFETENKNTGLKIYFSKAERVLLAWVVFCVAVGGPVSIWLS
jgi:hypothetical protein